MNEAEMGPETEVKWEFALILGQHLVEGMRGKYTYPEIMPGALSYDCGLYLYAVGRWRWKVTLLTSVCRLPTL